MRGEVVEGAWEMYSSPFWAGQEGEVGRRSLVKAEAYNT